MNKTYLLIDTMNLMWRAAHVTRGDAYTRVGLSLHVMLTSIMSVDNKFKPDHLIFAFDGYSWRKDYDPLYKMNRKIKAAERSRDEIEFQDYMLETLDDFKQFLHNDTNVSVLSHPMLEADDLIAGWCQVHGDDTNVILSSDGDYKQLLSDSVCIYDGIQKKLLTSQGSFDDNGKQVADPLDVEYFLFEKIIRGDTSDNIRPAYPGVRKKGTKNKTGIIQAFEDRKAKTFAWNSFMNETWNDQHGNAQLVADRYKHNELLIDLSKQPDEVKEKMAETIAGAYEQEGNKTLVGIKFIKFCGKHDLVNLSHSTDKLGNIFNRKLA